MSGHRNNAQPVRAARKGYALAVVLLLPVLAAAGVAVSAYERWHEGRQRDRADRLGLALARIVAGQDAGCSTTNALRYVLGYMRGRLNDIESLNGSRSPSGCRFGCGCSCFRNSDRCCWRRPVIGWRVWPSKLW